MQSANYRHQSQWLQILEVFKKYPDFRRYYIGLVTSVFGYRMIVDLTLGWLIFDLTQDERYLGYMFAALAVPTVVLNLLGGVLADKLDPRHLLGAVEGFSALMVAGLGILTLNDWVEPWHVILAGALFGAGQAFDEAARNTIYARLIDRRDMGVVVPLNSLVWPTSRSIAPIVAGYIVAKAHVGTAGVAPVVFMAAAGFLCMAVIAQTLHLTPAERAKGNVLREMLLGMQFIKKHSIFLYLVSFSVFIAIFGMSYLLFMPVFAVEVLEVGADGIGTLMTFAGIGSIIGLFTAARLANFERTGWVIIGGAMGFGSFVILFAISPWFWLSSAMVFIAGFFNSLYLTGVMTTLQLLVPDELRGRVMGIYTVCYGVIPLGTLQMAFVSSYSDPRVAVALGGSMVVIFAVFMGLVTRQVRTIGAVRLPVS